MIIAEATMVIEGNSAFTNEPGIYSPAQVEGWRKVTSAVHANGGRIVLQLWHGGRACHPLINGGQQPIAPSAIAILDSNFKTPNGAVPHAMPRALEDAEIPGVVEGFRLAAVNAKNAGFDGVEVHGANGYLVDQFLRDGSNKRTGPYGGSVQNRARFLMEILQAICSSWDAGRVGLRISPLNSFNDVIDSDPVGTYTSLAENLNAFNLAFLHVMRADFAGRQSGDLLTPLRKAFKGSIIANMGYTIQEAEDAIKNGLVDAVAFGKYFISNPDLPARIKAGSAFNELKPDNFYSQGPAGYTDYPALDAQVSSTLHA
jgi:N-ethylmaleimide reductase